MQELSSLTPAPLRSEADCRWPRSHLAADSQVACEQRHTRPQRKRQLLRDNLQGSVVLFGQQLGGCHHASLVACGCDNQACQRC